MDFMRSVVVGLKIFAMCAILAAIAILIWPFVPALNMGTVVVIWIASLALGFFLIVVYGDDDDYSPPIQVVGWMGKILFWALAIVAISSISKVRPLDVRPFLFFTIPPGLLAAKLFFGTNITDVLDSWFSKR